MKGWYAGGHREEQKNEFGSLEMTWASARRPGRAESATSSYSAANWSFSVSSNSICRATLPVEGAFKLWGLRECSLSIIIIIIIILYLRKQGNII